MLKKRVAIIGECMFELRGQPFGTMQHSFGGDTLNTAVYLSRMNKNVIPYYVTAIGSDETSTQMSYHWMQEGVATDFVLKDSDHPTGLYIINVDSRGERSFQYWRSNSAAKFMFQHPDFKTILNDIATMDIIYLSGISVAILNKEDRQQLFSSLEYCRNQGAEIVFDSNYRPALWETLAETQETYEKILQLTDIALVTFDDEQAVWKDKTATDTLTRLGQYDVKKAVVKMGSDGCIYQDLENSTVSESVPAIKVNNVVDTTSAGDSFNGAFLALYLTGQDLYSCCGVANFLAGHVIQHTGAIIPRTVTDNVYTSIKEYL